MLQKSKISRMAATAAIAGLIGGSAALITGCDQDKGSSSGTSVKTMSNAHQCKGMNACKGQGGCKTGDQGCKSQNSCKGKGGCKVS